MAHLRAHRSAEGIVHRYLRCMECGNTPLGPVSVEDAERTRIRHERDVHGVEPRRIKTPAGTALGKFLESRRAEGRKAGTVDFYRERLPAFFASMGERPMGRWTRADLEAFIVAHPDWKPRTVQALIRACRTFRAWALEASIEVADFVGSMKGPTVQRRRRRILSRDEIRRLIDTARNWPDVRRRRWAELAVTLAADAGFALGDIRALTWGEVNLKAGTLCRPRQKTQKPLWVPMTARLKDVLKRAREEKPAISGPVVRDIPGGGGQPKAVREMFKAAKIPREKGDGLHLLRHTFISALLAAGTPIATVADLVGSSPATIARFYAHSTDEQRREAIRGLEA